MTVNVELLWCEDCPNHVATDALIREVLHELGLRAPVHRIEVPDEPTGNRVRFPGSPTVRVNGRDIEPGFDPNTCVDCASTVRRLCAALPPLPDRRGRSRSAGSSTAKALA